MKPFWKAVVQGGACGLVTGMLLLIGGATSNPRSVGAQSAEPEVQELVKAKRIEVVDKDGRPRVVLGVSPGGPGPLIGLELLDSNGQRRVLLYLPESGDAGPYPVNPTEDPSLTLLDADGSSAVSLGLSDLMFSTGEGIEGEVKASYGASSWSVKAENASAVLGADEAMLFTLPDGRLELVFTDSKGQPIWGAPRTASAEDSKTYPGLSDLYNVPYTPKLADWRALQTTAALNCERGLTDRLARVSCTLVLRYAAPPGSIGLTVFLDSRTQPGWNTYLGNGRFSVSDREVRAAFQEACQEVLKMLRATFPAYTSGLEDEEVEILCHMRGTLIGTWRHGDLKLEGES